MDVTLSIGEFSRMTHLSVKTLRHYHRVGLLEPAEVDRHSGYRYYTTAQVPTAQIIRRFRELDMPVEQLRAVLAASDPDARGRLILDHLSRMEEQLRQTQDAVSSLRAMLTAPGNGIVIEYRTVPATSAIAVGDTVDTADLGTWWEDSLRTLRTALREHGLSATAPIGGLYGVDLFAEEHGEATMFVPVAGDVPAIAGGRVRPLAMPAAELAVATHTGSHADIDRTYGALGTHVAEHELAIEGPVREYYLVHRLETSDTSRLRTEIAWPIFRTAGR